VGQVLPGSAMTAGAVLRKAEAASLWCQIATEVHGKQTDDWRQTVVISLGSRGGRSTKFYCCWTRGNLWQHIARSQTRNFCPDMV
jgi:hypothetical protein